MICVAICTRQRPKMLRRLLKTCENISPDARTEMQFLVVENGPAEDSERIVNDFKGKLDITYHHEPRVGLVFARNAAIDAYLETGATWMGMFDDDEIISEQWLTAMLDAVEQYPDCKSFTGPHIRITPVEAINRQPKVNKTLAYKTGKVIWNVTTANMLIKREVFASDGLNLRFNPMFNLSGGEDTCLFYTLKDLGEKIIWVQEAKTFEPTVVERTQRSILIDRNIHMGQNWGRLTILRFGRWRGGALNIFYMFRESVNFITFGLTGIMVSIFSQKHGHSIVNSAMGKGLYAVGVYKSFFALLGTHYKDVIGE